MADESTWIRATTVILGRGEKTFPVMRIHLDNSVKMPDADEVAFRKVVSRVGIAARFYVCLTRNNLISSTGMTVGPYFLLLHYPSKAAAGEPFVSRAPSSRKESDMTSTSSPSAERVVPAMPETSMPESGLTTRSAVPSSASTARM